MRNAKIVCTIGPASDDRDTIRGLADAGMSVVRLNASHGTTDHRETVIERARAVDEEIDDPLAVMVDLKGPEVRTAEIDEPIALAEGSEVTFSEGDDATPERVGLTHSIGAADPVALRAGTNTWLRLVGVAEAVTAACAARTDPGADAAEAADADADGSGG